MSDEHLELRPLFGGAIHLLLPPRFADVSLFRPVPDHQEVFADGSRDQSLVVEVVEHAAGVPDAGAAEFFWHDLAGASGALHAALGGARRLGPDELPGLPPGTAASVAEGTHVVAKGAQGADAANRVHVALAAVRLPRHGSDLLLVLNTPVFISPASAAAEHAGAGFKTGHLAAGALLARIVASLQVVDYGLFGGAGERER